MTFFRKKPVVIEAVQWTCPFKETPPAWIILALNSPVGSEGFINRIVDNLHIHTLEGVMVASVNDWIIKGVNGEVYPCKPEIFEKTYEPA